MNNSVEAFFFLVLRTCFQITDLAKVSCDFSQLQKVNAGMVQLNEIRASRISIPLSKMYDLSPL